MRVWGNTRTSSQPAEAWGMSHDLQIVRSITPTKLTQHLPAAWTYECTQTADVKGTVFDNHYAGEAEGCKAKDSWNIIVIKHCHRKKEKNITSLLSDEIQA